MSNFFSKKEYQEIADRFKLGQISNITHFKQGQTAPKVVVKIGKESFVISKYKIGRGENFKNKPRESLQKEIDLLMSLKKLPVPKYLAFEGDRYILNFKNFGITIYRYLDGKTPKKINTRMAYELGKFLGNFHKQGVRIKTSFAKRYKFYDFPRHRVNSMKRYAYKQTDLGLKTIVKEVERAIVDNKPSKNLPQGPIHVDIKFDNELFKGNKLTGIVDFGNFYQGPLILDVGKAIIFNCIKDDKIDKKLLSSFLKGYQVYRKLNRLEKKYLDKAIIYGIYSHFWLDLYHVPLKLVSKNHLLYYVRSFLPAVRKFAKSKNLQ